MHQLFHHYAAFFSNYHNFNFLGVKWNRDNNNFNPSRSLVLIIPEAAWAIYAPWNLELYAWYEAESYNIDTPWKKMLIDAVIITCPMCILQIWKCFSWPQRSMNFFCQEGLLMEVSRWYHLLIPRYSMVFIFPYLNVLAVLKNGPIVHAQRSREGAFSFQNAWN